MAHGRRNALEITHGSEAYIEIQILAQGNVDAAGTLSYRSHQRALDGQSDFADSPEGAFGQIRTE